jgi:hypothetical protein
MSADAGAVVCPDAEIVRFLSADQLSESGLVNRLNAQGPRLVELDL